MEATRPDIETSSEGYASRFDGPVGDYFLETQGALIADLLRKPGVSALSILEIGGGHLQLAPRLMALGHQVFVHGSAVDCFNRLPTANRPEAFVGDFLKLPFADQSFDVVLAVRLIAHVETWRVLLQEMARVARSQIILDYAPLESLNFLTPLLFPLKKMIEKNTRTYLCHRTSELRQEFHKLGFSNITVTKQFFLPMGIHRALNRVESSRSIEQAAKVVGLTSIAGSPAIISAVKGDA